MEEGLKDVNVKKNADGSYSVICRFPTSEKAQALSMWCMLSKTTTTA